jgi:hypothetical protein
LTHAEVIPHVFGIFAVGIKELRTLEQENTLPLLWDKIQHSFWSKLKKSKA